MSNQPPPPPFPWPESRKVSISGDLAGSESVYTAADAIAPQAPGMPRRNRTISRKVSGTTDVSASPASSDRIGAQNGSAVNISTSVSSGSSNAPLSALMPSTRENKEAQRPAPYGVIGVCALDSKARSKPSRTILNRLIANNEFDVTIFGDKVILDEDVENWPVCDYLISFFSAGFPLDKAVAYARLRRPYCVNDLPMQKVLWDRRLCLTILDALNVPTPRRVEVNRDGGPVFPIPDVVKRTVAAAGGNLDTATEVKPPLNIELIDDGDTLVVDGVAIRKPFVEKPVSGEDHNIHIYYPSKDGGGGRRLFRKVNNKSSDHDQTLLVPRCLTEPGSSYLYEEFLQAEGAEDVKAYTVGPDFCHAETRKSPVVDGLVKRNPSGKEVRYVTTLSPSERSMASRIALGFKQNICGFDLLRANGQSYVIDVNGWSFVKDSEEYYDQCAAILKKIFLAERAKREGHLTSSSNVTTPGGSLSSPGLGPTTQFDISRRRVSVSQRPSSRIPSTGGGRGGMGNAAVPFASSAPIDIKDGFAAQDPARVSSCAVASSSSSLSSARTSNQIEKPAFGTGYQSMEEVSRIPNLPENEINLSDSPGTTDESDPEVDTPATAAPPPASQSQWKLKGIVSVIRHADRTPKQKFKFTFHTRPFVDLLKGHTEEVLLIGETALQSVLTAVNKALAEGIEDMAKLHLLKTSLERKGGWPGTKVQIKPMFRKRRTADDVGGIILSNGAVRRIKEDAAKHGQKDNAKPENGTSSVPGGAAAAAAAARLSATQSRTDSMNDVTLSRISAAENNLVLDKLQLIIKWGGEPTHSATYQAEDLGEMLRNDLLLMNKSILDNVEIFSSSERRSTRSARVFASHFLNDPCLPEDFVSIRKDLLDDSNAAKDEMDKVKKKLKMLLRKGDKAQFDFAWPEDMPEPYLVAREVVELMKFHRRVMHHNLAALNAAQASGTFPSSAQPVGSEKGNDGKEGEDEKLSPTTPGAKTFPPQSVLEEWCSGENPELFKERWEKLFAEFCDADKVDPSKISELYDSMKFDALHNRQFLEWVFTPSESMLDEYSAGEDDQEAHAIDAAVAGAQQHLQEQSYFNLFTGIGRICSKMNKSKEKVTRGSSESNQNRSKEKGGDGKGGSGTDGSTLNASPVPDNTGSGAVSAAAAAASSARYDPTRFGSSDHRLIKMRELYRLCKVLFDYIGPQEYGMENEEKLEIGLLTSLPLLKEIVHDLEELQASETGKGFFYFTKESHIYTLLNCIIEGGIPTKIARNNIPELDYLSQIFFELYESPDSPDESSGEDRFKYSIRLSISPGCHTFDPLDVQLDEKHCIGYAPRRSLTAHIDWKQITETLRAKFHTVKLPKTFIAINLSEKVPHVFERASRPVEEGGGSGSGSGSGSGDEAKDEQAGGAERAEDKGEDGGASLEENGSRTDGGTRV